MRLHRSPLLAALLAGSVLLGSTPALADEPGPAPAAPQRAAAPVPPYAIAEEAPQLMSPGLTIAGIVVGGAGLVGSLTGLVLMNSKQTITCSDPTAPCPTSTREIGTTMLIVSAPVLAVGIAMAIIGARPAQVKAAMAHGVPAIAIGPTGGMVSWVF